MKEEKIIEDLSQTDFTYVISLGFFCSVASDLEKLGLRSTSGPVDWVWSTWKGINHCLLTRFEDFMEYENIEQSNADNCIYADRKNGIVSFHDYSRYKSFERQYPIVKEKYNRRIKRFYEEIKEPTLFIRYIWNGEYDGKKANEIYDIEKDYVDFCKFLKGFNSKNEVIYVANNDVKSEMLPIFHVEIDPGDAVNRHPLFGNELLKNYLENMNFQNREKNIEQYIKKQKKNASFSNRAKKKIQSVFQKLFMKKYTYKKIYNHEVYKC